ncbi:hypothetical protein HBI56_201990 [Parastagonospora nodorum]|nr:hypothetical protein HBH56_216520 [Parastagonospora nodorum]KAH3922693.1 hypothetical protein HBH54_221010 [Parastagonospora nodorum]KAH3942149.1 hypothetical protein HBH53_190930 [Parastagonospora nodorum]KAH4018846.1 hypothetical protein HBI09_190380 [Parastagonospora nodorum]KAH4115462.1 hypothetical protein HBH47_182710 [Parastagonospora nodorum]
MASTSAALYSSEDNMRIKVGGISYLLVSSEQNYLAEITTSVITFQPVFVYKVSPGDHVTQKNITEYLDTSARHDDIYNSSFSSYIVFLAPAPYMVDRKMTWQPWRINADKHDTMVTSFRLKSTFDRQPRQIQFGRAGHTVYAVDPPRCYFQKSLEKPLNGVRIVVKDIFDIAGTKTTLCNKAWRDLYSVSSEHAPTIRSLLENDAITTAKTKPNAMTIREETMECVEYLAPFNPRGDDYQTSSGSSSESCAALVAYDWLDFAIGSDTNGSCRKLAHWNGVFAIRPTHGILSINGVSSSFPMFDVLAFFRRDLAAFPNLEKAWYGNSLTAQEPKGYLPTDSVEQSEVIKSFIRDLEAALGTKRTETSLAKEWISLDPLVWEKMIVAEYLKENRISNSPGSATDKQISSTNLPLSTKLCGGDGISQRNWNT